jgi:hypothetical protein
MNETDDRAIIEAARAALERSAAASREAYANEPDDERAMLHLIAELRDEACASLLANLDPTQPLSRLGAEAIQAGQHALRRDANDWSHLAAAAVDDGWRAEFEAEAAAATQNAHDILALHHRLAERDLSAEQGGGEVRAWHEPAPPPFPVGVQVRYTGPDEADWSDGREHVTDLQHDTVGLVVRTFPGIPGRAPGTYGPEDDGYRTLHGYSEVAYLCAVPVVVAAEAGPGWQHPADQFQNLEHEGVPAELAEERLAGFRVYEQSIRLPDHDAEAEAER